MLPVVDQERVLAYLNLNQLHREVWGAARIRPSRTRDEKPDERKLPMAGRLTRAEIRAEIMADDCTAAFSEGAL